MIKNSSLKCILKDHNIEQVLQNSLFLHYQFELLEYMYQDLRVKGYSKQVFHLSHKNFLKSLEEWCWWEIIYLILNIHQILNQIFLCCHLHIQIQILYEKSFFTAAITCTTQRPWQMGLEHSLWVDLQVTRIWLNPSSTVHVRSALFGYIWNNWPGIFVIVTLNL